MKTIALLLIGFLFLQSCDHQYNLQNHKEDKIWLFPIYPSFYASGKMYTCGAKPIKTQYKNLDQQAQEVFGQIDSLLKSVHLSMDNVVELTYTVNKSLAGPRLNNDIIRRLQKMDTLYFTNPPIWIERNCEEMEAGTLISVEVNAAK